MTFSSFLRKAFTIAVVGASLVYPMYVQNNQGRIEFDPGSRIRKELTATLGSRGAQMVMNPASHFKISDIHYLRLVNTLIAYDEARAHKSSPYFKSRLSFVPDMKLTLSDVVNRPAFYMPDARTLPAFLNAMKF